ncbi:hypothetical protein ABG768_025650 [Culter alburnus]|uniref:Ig-like domain-containing protein n=1 Tax=Culter alburnus TaxID=194366 RepID=A0AAW2AF41_CULAL
MKSSDSLLKMIQIQVLSFLPVRIGLYTLTVTPDRSVFTGERVNLTCEINSDHSNWRYEWNKDSLMLQTSERYTVNRDILSIVGAVKTDEGQYTCKGHIEGRSVSSQSSSAVSLSVMDKPKPNLTVKPQSSVFTGDTVTLSCDVGQSTGWTFLWRKDSNTESTDEATKTISSVKVSDGGTYQCRAKRGKYDTEISDIIEITVRERPKPVVRVQPDVHVFRGETVTLTCDIQEETGVWQYSWYKDQDYSAGQDQIYYSAGQDPIYKIKSVDQHHAGVYSCKGTQTKATQYTEKSDKVKLTVSKRPKPVVKVKPDQHVFRGETVTLTCDIQGGGNIRWTYSWFKDGKTHNPYRTTAAAEFSFTAEVSYSGEYSCGGVRSDSQRSDISDAVSLTVSERPKPVVKVTPDQPVFRGERVTLTCDIQGGGNIQWTYSCFTADVSDSGEYSCRGERSDSQRSDTSAAVTLTVSEE